MVSITLLTSGPLAGCRATMLDFDGEIRILADPGWDGKNPADVLFLEHQLSSVDAMLLLQLTPEHMGAYVLLCVHFPILMAAIPVYATVAVSQLARVSTVEFYRARGVLGPVALALVEVSDVDEWLDKVVLVKYRQNMALLEHRLSVTAYASGHTLGGAFWLLSRRAERVVYAPSWNHSRDSFLNSAGFLSATSGAPEPSLVRPTALVTGAAVGSAMPHARRAEKFLLLVDATLANGGAVLLPVAISGRFLELVRIVDDHLARLPGAAVPVYFLSYSGTKVMSYAGSLLDWMSAQLARHHEALSDTNNAHMPFAPATVDLLLDPRELARLPGPKIVFASGVDMAPGDLSVQAMQFLCQDEKLTLILTEKSPCATQSPVAARLYAEWYALASAKNGGVAEDGVPVPLEQALSTEDWVNEEPLAGRELADFKTRVAALRRQKLLAKVRATKNKHILAADDDSLSDGEQSSEDEEAMPAASAEPASAAQTSTDQPAQPTATDVLPGHEVFVGDYIAEALRTNKPLDIRVTVKMRPKQLMFPMPPMKKRKVDDYGEVIDPKDFLLTDDNSANNKLISESKRKFEINDKGKWGERDERRRRGRQGNDRRLAKSKLTPQEVLNNEVLQRNLDTLFRPVKRLALRESARSLPPFQLRCGLSFVDLAGRVDVRSLVMVASVLRPQNVVLLPDTSYTPGVDVHMDGRRLLEAAFAKQTLEQKTSAAGSSLVASSRFGVLTGGLTGASRGSGVEMAVLPAQPNVVEQIGGDGAGRLREFEVRLDEQLDALLAWQKLAGNYRITKVRGELGVYELQLSLNKLHADTLALNSHFILTPVVLETSQTSTLAPGNAGFGSGLAIGNIRLPELKKKLLALGMAAEFKGEGMLVVNDEVAIRKTTTGAYQGEDTGDLVLDGQVGPLYYKVRSCIREMLAFV